MQYGTARPSTFDGADWHSARLSGAAIAGCVEITRKNRSPIARRTDLLIPESFNWLKPRRPRRRIQTGNETDHDRKSNCSRHQPPRDRKDAWRRKVLLCKVKVRADGDGSIDEPT